MEKLWTDFLSKLHAQWKLFSVEINSAAQSNTNNSRLDESFLKMLGVSASARHFRGQLLAENSLKDLLAVLMEKAEEGLNELTKVENSYKDADSKVISKQKELDNAKTKEQQLQGQLAHVFPAAQKAAILKQLNEQAQKITEIKKSLQALTVKRTILRKSGMH